MRQRGLVWFVVAVTAMTLELVRSTGPLMDSVYSSAGMNTAITLVVLTYAGPGIVVAAVALARRALPRYDGIVVLVAPAAILVVLRLVAQGTAGQPKVVVTLAAVATSVAVLVLAVTALASGAYGGRLAVPAVGAGLVVAVLVQLVLGTWDAIWRDAVLGWAVAALLSLAVIAAAVTAARGEPVPDRRAPRRVWALGPFVALATLITANPAFVASQAGVGLLVAGAVATLGLVGAAGAALHLTEGRELTTTVVAGAVLTLAVAALLQVPREGGPTAPVLAGVVVVQLASVLSLRGAVRRGPEPTGPGQAVGWRTAVTAAVAGLTAIVPMMLFQIEYRTPLGYANYVSVTAAALLLGVAGVRRPAATHDRVRRPARRPLLVGAAATVAALALAGLGSLATGEDRELDTSRPADPASVRILLWNMHYAVNGSGSLDLAAVAGAIERHDPDVVMLNEVARGWLIGGGADDAAWLAHRLGGHWAFAPAADRQFGNMLLSRWPLADVRRVELPQAGGTQARSMLSTTVTTPLGDLTVMSVHLEDGAGRAAVRHEQVPVLLATLDALESPLVFGGDLNAEPTSDEITAITGAGYVSAIDDVGDPSAMTQPSVVPDRRIDWLFGDGVRFLTAEVLVDEQQSDHLPVLVTLVP